MNNYHYPTLLSFNQPFSLIALCFIFFLAMGWSIYSYPAAAEGKVNSIPSEYGKVLTTTEITAITDFLAKNQGLRMASLTDNKNKIDANWLKNAREYSKDPNYHPYLRKGDFNNDGREDFIACFIQKEAKFKNHTGDNKGPFTVVVFHGAQQGYAPPVILERNVDLWYGEIEYRKGENHFFVEYTSGSCNKTMYESKNGRYQGQNCAVR